MLWKGYPCSASIRNNTVAPDCKARLTALCLRAPDQSSANSGRKLTIAASGALDDE